MKPVRIAVATRQSPKPRGLKITETGWAISARMESSMGSTSSSEMSIFSAICAI